MNGELIEDLRWLRSPHEGLWVWWLAAALLLTVALWLTWRIRLKKKQGVPLFKPAPPHVRALKALAELEPLLAAGDDLEFVKKVSQVARVYIQERFGLRAPHRSTEEFLWEAEGNALLAAEHRELLGVFLSQCDLVKFAKRRADTEQMSGLLRSARQFVEATIPANDGEAAP